MWQYHLYGAFLPLLFQLLQLSGSYDHARAIIWVYWLILIKCDKYIALNNTCMNRVIGNCFRHGFQLVPIDIFDENTSNQLLTSRKRLVKYNVHIESVIIYLYICQGK